MKDMGDTPELAKGTYRHYKGGVYEVIELACHTETLEWYVVYQSVERNEQGLPSIWVRPYDMFVEIIKINGVSTPRFKKVES